MAGGATVDFIDPDTLKSWREAGTVDLYDVREEAEHAQAHIPGATLLPLSRFDPARVTVTPGRNLVFHCKSGVRCGMAPERLVAAGYEGAVHRLEGGIIAWHQAGGEIEAGG